MRPSDLLPSDLAAALGVRLRSLRKMADDTSVFYHPTRIEIVKGKARSIDPPKYEFKRLMRRLHRFFQKQFPFHSAAHGGVKGRSCFTAASVHCGRRFVVTRDITDCYPSISKRALKRQLRKVGFRSDTAAILAALMTLRNSVPQGCPVSNDALNFFMFEADTNISEQTVGWGRFTRTADDLVISFDEAFRQEEAAAIIEHEIRSIGLEINTSKREKSGLQSTSGRQLVHAIVVNSSRGTAICPEYVSQATEAALAYVRDCRNVTADNLEALAKLRQKVHGWLHYCNQATFGPTAYVRRLLKTGDKRVTTTLRRVSLTHSRKWWVINNSVNRPQLLVRRWRRSRTRRWSKVC